MERGRKGEPPGRAPGRERHAGAGGGGGTEPCPGARGPEAPWEGAGPGCGSGAQCLGATPAPLASGNEITSARHPEAAGLRAAGRVRLATQVTRWWCVSASGCAQPVTQKVSVASGAGCHHPTGPRDREGRAEITLLCQGRCVPPTHHPRSLSKVHTFNLPNRSLGFPGAGLRGPQRWFLGLGPTPHGPFPAPADSPSTTSPASSTVWGCRRNWMITDRHAFRWAARTGNRGAILCGHTPCGDKGQAGHPRRSVWLHHMPPTPADVENTP